MGDAPLRALVAGSQAYATHATWWLFAAAAVAALVCLVLRGADLVRRAALGERDARLGTATGVLLFAAALALRLWLPERVHYTFNDEYEYVAYARLLAETGQYRLLTGPPAGVWLYAAALSIFGLSSAAVFGTTLVLASATPPALAWVLRLLGVGRAVAVLAAVLLVVAPLHVKHAASASLEVASLLFVLLSIGSAVELLRRPSALASASFALSLFAALSTRLENLALLVLLPLVVWLWRPPAGRDRPPAVRDGGLRYWVPAGVAVLLAAAYVPAMLDAPIRYDPWWKSRLPLAELLRVNLGFWVGGEPMLRKLPLLIAAVGAIAALRSSARAALFWIAFLALYSVVFAVYGLNVGWVEEVHQPPPWGARAAGHDMFRFNVLLLPVATYFLASGLVAVGGAIAALVRGDRWARARPRGVRLAALAAGTALAVALLAWRGEHASYDPLGFVASRYNRGFEIAELRFLQDFFADAGGRPRCFVLPPSEGIALAEVEVLPVAALDEPAPPAGSASHAYLYVNARQLAVPQLRRRVEAIGSRHALREVARREVGRDVFYLFAVRPEAAWVRKPA